MEKDLSEVSQLLTIFSYLVKTEGRMLLRCLSTKEDEESTLTDFSLVDYSYDNKREILFIKSEECDMSLKLLKVHFNSQDEAEDGEPHVVLITQNGACFTIDFPWEIYLLSCK